MYIDTRGNTAQFSSTDSAARVDKVAVAFTNAEGEAPKLTVEMQDLSFKADIYPEAVTFTNANVFDLRDGVRIELYPAFQRRAGWLRYFDGTIVGTLVEGVGGAEDVFTPAEITAFSIDAADMADIKVTFTVAAATP